MNCGKFVLVSSAALFVVSQASAADIAKSVYKAPRPAAVVAHAHNWTGLYVGGHVGGAWGNADWVTDVSIPSELVSPHLNGWLGGAQVGYRWQFASWVVGVEGMFSWTDNLDKFERANLSPIAFPNRYRGTDLKNIYTFTGQIGHTWDNWLVFAKAGWAGGTDITLRHDNLSPGGSKATWSDDASGWTVGAGVEWAWTRNWSLGVEYNYYDLSTNSLQTFNTSGLLVNVFTFDSEIHTVVARLNYRFDWGKGSVAAKY